jgi:Tfp pilus assembly protein PilV
MGPHPSLRDESGFALLEVLVSGALLAVMVLAIFTTFDVSNRVTQKDRARAVAASLAQADQERLRVLTLGQLNAFANQGPQAAGTKTVNGTTYTTTSRADWLADADQTTSCTSNGAAADYVKIVSTVTAPPSTGIRPVTLTSVVTPPVGAFNANQGSLAVSVLGANGLGKAGVAVTLSGTASATRTTDATGCAFFGYMPAGAYSLGISAVGHVTDGLLASPSVGVTIAPETVSTKSFKYDVADDIAVSFDTQAVKSDGSIDKDALGVPKLETSTNSTLRGRQVTFSHSSLTVPAKVFGSSTPVQTLTANGLFPFTTGYGVYAGNCDGAKPTPTQTVLATPTGPPSIVVRMPRIVARVQSSAGASLSGQTVKVTPKGTGCAATQATLGGGSATTNSSGRVSEPLPYGPYELCVRQTDRGTKVNVVNATDGLEAIITMPNAPNTVTC